MGIRASLIVLGAIYLLNGLWTVAEPSVWYATLPGVSATGPFNAHFVEDIGFAGVASGALLVLGGWRNSAAFAIGGRCGRRCMRSFTSPDGFSTACRWTQVSYLPMWSESWR